jgi:uncharacterized protein YjbJ (UPF0337 family)
MCGSVHTNPIPGRQQSPHQCAPAHIFPAGSGIGCDAAAFIVYSADDVQLWRTNMNKDQVKGTAKDVAGKIQEQAGKLVGSKEQQVKGLSKQISGKVQKGVGDAEESVKEFNKR